MNETPPYGINCRKGDAFMNGVYEIRFENRSVGKAQVCQSGLYTHIVCRCEMATKDMMRIFLSGEDWERDLGTCLLEDGNFTLKTKFPSKYIGDGDMEFRLIPYHTAGKFFPIEEGKPFENMVGLMGGKFAIKNNIPGIVI